MKIGIIGAMELEVKLLREHLKNRKEITLYNFKFHQGEMGNHQVIVLLSGIGKVSASVGTSLLINHFQPDLLINTGTAGGLKHTHVYDVILASEVRHHDVDVTAFGYEIGQQAQMPPAFFTDDKWLKMVQNDCLENNIPFHTGLVVSGDAFISSPEKCSWIENTFPEALAVEMEAAAIAQTCYLMKTPFLLLRAISDNAGEGDTISYDTFVEKAGKFSAEMNIRFIENIP